MSDKDLQDAGTVHDLLRKKYLYWLESLSLLRTMPVGVMVVQKLEALVEARQVTEHLRDPRRFILLYKPVIEIAPLQVYASALGFSPEHSLIRELFRKQEPNWMILKPRVEANWNAYLQTLEGYGGEVGSVAFSADGQRLASGSGSGDGTVKVCDTATGACMQTLEVSRATTHLSFDPMSSSRLFTDIGLLNLDTPAQPPAIESQSTEAVSRGASHCGYCVSTDGVWVVKDGKGMLGYLRSMERMNRLW